MAHIQQFLSLEPAIDRQGLSVPVRCAADLAPARVLVARLLRQAREGCRDFRAALGTEGYLQLGSHVHFALMRLGSYCVAYPLARWDPYRKRWYNLAGDGHRERANISWRQFVPDPRDPLPPIASDSSPALEDGLLVLQGFLYGEHDADLEGPPCLDWWEWDQGEDLGEGVREIILSLLRDCLEEVLDMTTGWEVRDWPLDGTCPPPVRETAPATVDVLEWIARHAASWPQLVVGPDGWELEFRAIDGLIMRARPSDRVIELL